MTSAIPMSLAIAVLLDFIFLLAWRNRRCALLIRLSARRYNNRGLLVLLASAHNQSQVAAAVPMRQIERDNDLTPTHTPLVHRQNLCSSKVIGRVIICGQFARQEIGSSDFTKSQPI